MMGQGQLKNLNRDREKMSSWGIGPVFGIYSVIISGILIFFTYIYPGFFIFNCCNFLCYILGGVIILSGLFLWISAGRSVNNYIQRGILATKGVYGIVRNPIYSGIFAVMTGVFLIMRSWLLLSSLPVIYLILNLLLRKEEKVLSAVFGEEYNQYRKEVNSVIPKIRSFHRAFFYPVETGKIDDNLFVIRSKDINIFIYRTGDSFICFDTGYGNKEMLQEFEKLNIEKDKISHIFLTHTDYDHTKGLKFFRDAEVYLGKNEESLINGEKSRFKGIYNNPELNCKYDLLEDNEIVNIDDIEIKVIFTPGHTTGHVAYLVNKKILITGDSVVIQNGFIKPFYKLLSMDHKLTIKSAKILSEFKEITTICTSHTGILFEKDRDH